MESNSDSVNDLPDTGLGDPNQDPHLSSLVDKLEARLGTLGRLAEEATELADHVPALASAFTLDQAARIAVALKDCRDKVSHAKTRLTAAEIGNNEWFAQRIASDAGDVFYRTSSHSFKASARGIYTAPNQRTKPGEFNAVLEWLRNLSPDATKVLPVIDVAFDGTITVQNFNEVCESVRENGGKIHPHVGEFRVPSVKITKRR